MGKGTSWIEKVADQVVRRVEKIDPGRKKIVCASGISPSGSIHLGNLRELMTVHLVAESLRGRGYSVDHLHSWDDFDRLRKVPKGVEESFSEHIGRPLAEIPDPFGDFPSYADRYIQEFEGCARRIGVEARYIRQHEMYRSGAYREGIKKALAQRFEIFDILAEYQTAGRHEKSVEERRREYYPFRVYCHSCNRDSTRIEHWDPDTAVMSYTCSSCSHEASFNLDEEIPGKLVWKVDWPMRWGFEGVDFEPAGEDHSAPGSSRTVGQRIVKDVYGAEAPFYVGYAFVGVSGQTKISSSAGTAATPSSALEIIEPSILRWLYIRRNVRQQFSIDFGQEMLRLYDEWDALVRRVESGEASDLQKKMFESCVSTSTGSVARTSLPVSFRLLSSAADLTQGTLDQVLRIVGEHLEDSPSTEELKERLEPRLTCAIRWVTRYVPDEQRTRVKESFDHETWESLDSTQQEGVHRMAAELGDYWSLDGLTKLVYGLPKVLLGLPMDADPTPEVKKAQRGFFIALYSLLVGQDTGPRLPTLLLSLGQEKVRQLLTEPGSS